MKKSHSDAVRGSSPASITLLLSDEEREIVGKVRIQNRTIRSVRLGKLSVDYETGITAAGARLIPGELDLFAAPGMTFAYDTVFSVAVLRYVHLMQREEIQAKILREHFFHISAGSVSELSLMGLAYLEQCHFANAGKLAELYGKGCFIMHLDGTNEGGMYDHFVVREGVRGNVLYAEKIVSESEKSVKDVLMKVKGMFGDPDAVVSDMSASIGKAVEEIFKGVPHRLCHYHFLKAVGKSLLSDKHAPMMISVKRMKEMLTDKRKELGAELESCRNREKRDDGGWLISLIDYINDYQKDLSGEGFPFDLPALAFYRRCETASNTMGEILNDPARNIQDEIKTTMWFIRNRLQEYFGYSHINQLKNLNDIFMELRDILHPKTEKEKVPLNWGMINQDIQIEDIAGGLEKLRVKAEKKVKTNLSPYLTKAWRTVLRRLNKYKGKLNPIIELKGEKFVLPRTNNLCETGFRDCKRKARRTTGTKNLSNHMDNLPPQYFYTFNLNDKEYIRTIFGDGEVCDSFHKIDKDAVRAGIEKMKVQRLSPKMIDYKLIRSNSYLDQITEHFTSRSKVTSDLNREDAA